MFRRCVWKLGCVVNVQCLHHHQIIRLSARLTPPAVLCTARHWHCHSPRTVVLVSVRPLSMSCNLQCPKQASSTTAQPPAIDKIVCPQGIQGSDCATFEIWLDNCRKFRLPNCEEHVNALNDGKKTISDVFAEQDGLICRIAADYKSGGQSAENVQPPQPDKSSQQGVQTMWARVEPPLLPKLLAADNPCPEGSQAIDCERLRAYLSASRQYSFSDCEQQLLDVQSGRKTVGDILQERDELLQEICNYSDARTSGREGDAPEAKLTQVQRLKRAIKEYGAVVIVFHVCISIISLGGFYTAVSRWITVHAVTHSWPFQFQKNTCINIMY